ncbi:MAG: carboxypeptidase-like regulatory domain-containing protein [Odoribacteraceae bacterium]|jgi:hypothetical protein|nr:carboxypeptidase-like regulatory domain-containing protein [Odoribacteraceae bacterium]
MTRLPPLLLLLAAFALPARAAGPGDSLVRLTVVDEASLPVFGVYVIHARLARLLTTSGLDGECLLEAGELSPGDTIRFQGVGYRSLSRAWGDLLRSRCVVMKELTYELEEVVVLAGPGRASRPPRPDELVERAMSKLGKLPRSTPPYCNFHGKARYEKITEYRHRAVEYRREFGYYFTSGNVTPVNAWDSRFCSYFLPAYCARSHNLTNNGKEILSPVYMTTDAARFDAGTRKVFTLLRAVQLHGPLFAGTGSYEITAIETNRTEYRYRFQTRPGAYPGKTKITCRGTFTIDRERQELRDITFDYIDYQLYRQVLLGERGKVASPFSTRATITFTHDDGGKARVATCLQETYWKYNLGENFVLIEQPSRPDPARGELVEREAFRCDDYRPVLPPLRDRETRAKIHAVQRNPAGAYDEEIFRRLPPLLADSAAIADLSRFEEIDEQFRANSNVSYYPPNHLKGFNGITRDDLLFRENLELVRRQLFKLFPLPPVDE